MSTKSSMYYSGEHGIHLYTDGFNRDNVYLDVYTTGNHFTQKITVSIPVEVWAEMRTHAGPGEEYLGKTYEEMLEMGKSAVRAHRGRLEEYKGKPLAGFAGVLVYGKATGTEAEMLENWMEFHWRGAVDAVDNSEFAHGSNKPDNTGGDV